MDAEELPDLPAAIAEAGDRRQRLAIDDRDALVHAVGQEQGFCCGSFEEAMSHPSPRPSVSFS